MKFVRAALLFIICFNATLTFSQSDSVKLNITLYEGGTKRPLSGVNVINPKSSTTASSDSKGFVQVIALKHDNLFLFCPGYRIRQVSVADSVPKAEYHLQIMMEPLTMTTKETLVIKAPKTLEQIEEERNRLGITPKELDRPKIYASSPISALYDMLSHREKERETLKRQIAVDDRNKVIKELLNYYNDKKIIDLPFDHYDDFIRFANLPTDFLKNHSDYEIMKTVKTLYDKYARLSGLVK